MGLPQQSAGLAGRSTKFIGRQEVLVEIVKLSCLLKHVLVLTQLFRAVQVNKLIERIRGPQQLRQKGLISCPRAQVLNQSESKLISSDYLVNNCPGMPS